MRTVTGLLLAALCGAAQTPPPAALIRGVLLERDSSVASGEFSVRAADNQVFRYQFDRKTYVEREKLPIDVTHLQPGEKVEVLSDSVPGILLRYARTIHVLEDAPPKRPMTAGRYRASRPAEDRLLPTGNLTFSGVIFRMNGERLVLRTRSGEQTLQLRKDTRYLRDGSIVDPEMLTANTRVFVRAGKDLYGEVEAYQVVWGTILVP